LACRFVVGAEIANVNWLILSPWRLSIRPPRDLLSTWAQAIRDDSAPRLDRANAALNG
jgi:hypothetical protein